MSIFQTSETSKMLHYHLKSLICCQNGADLEIRRRLEKRSLLNVNEHFQASEASKMLHYHNKLLEVEVLLNILYLLPLILLRDLYRLLAFLALDELLLLV